MTRSAVGREIGRAVLAFGIYLVLYPVWMAGGAHDLYAGLIRGIGGQIVIATQHFPLISSLERVRVSYFDFAIILCACCALLPGRLALPKRLRRFGVLALVMVIFHVLGFVLETYMDAAADLLKNPGIALFLPWEVRILDGLKYLLVDLGLNAWPFIVIFMGAVWNAGISFDRPSQHCDAGLPVPPPGSARQRGPRIVAGTRLLSARTRAVLGSAIVLFAVAGAWRYARESDPRHVETHVVLGSLFMRDGLWNDALEQYAIAIAHGTTNGEAWLNSARIQVGQGRPREAARLISRARNVVSNAQWRDKLTEMTAGLAVEN